MAPTVSKHKRLGDRNHGGALFILPRELRDEIYRLLLKRYYTIFYSKPLKWQKSKTRDKKTYNPGLVILRLSRTISFEAQELLYAESIFHVTVDFGMNSVELKRPTQALNRVRKVKITIKGLTPQFDGYDAKYSAAGLNHRIEAICGHTIDNFMGTLIRRDSCHIQLCEIGSHIVFPLTSYLLPKFAAFNGFATVLVEVSTEKKNEQSVPKQCYHYRRNSSQSITRILESFGTIVTGKMEPTMGPTISSIHGFTIRLEFKPRQHVPSILRAQAQKLLLEADRLEQGD